MLGINKRTNENAERKVRLMTIVILQKKENSKEQIVSNTNENHRTEKNIRGLEL